MPADWGLASPGLSLPCRFFGACLPLEASLLPQQPRSPGQPSQSLPVCFLASWQGRLMGSGSRLAPEMQWATGVTATYTKERLSQCPPCPGGVTSCCPDGCPSLPVGGNPADGRVQKTAGRHKPHLIALRARINQIMDKLLIGLT